MEPLSYFDENIPCLAACPVHTNAGAYVAAIADGLDEQAYLTARLPNPFASVCGRVCAAPCEDACRRGQIDEPIAIRALKRFVTEQFGAEAGEASRWDAVDAPAAVQRGERVAVVGGGPAGLAAAHDLRLLGYSVTIFEESTVLGGMMRLGIPEYRLDRELLDAEIASIVGLGVEVQLGTRLGRDVTLEALGADFDATFLAIGATKGRDLDIPGHDADGVFRAVEFLLNINQGFHVDIGDRVVVIGGGNVALDAARTALRAAAYDEAQGRSGPDAAPTSGADVGVRDAVDVARTAMRAGATEVLVVSLESETELPASRQELEDARDEGIRFAHRRGPARIVVENGTVKGLETVGVRSVFDADGRFAPTFDEDDRLVHGADTVILAIGQAVDLDAIEGTALEISPRHTLGVDDALATTLPGVWAGGDAAHGPRNLIDAIADGRRAAEGIHRSLSGDSETARPEGRMVELEQFHRLRDDYDDHNRVSIPMIPSERRIGLREIELGLTPEQARCEASRCLRCFANILLDPSACVLCGLCADVCPLDLISLVPAVEVGGGEGTALLLDESACIRCGLCIERCPPDALSMGVWEGVGVAIPGVSR